jgi:hypothetical protein
MQAAASGQFACSCGLVSHKYATLDKSLPDKWLEVVGFPLRTGPPGEDFTQCSFYVILPRRIFARSK